MSPEVHNLDQPALVAPPAPPAVAAGGASRWLDAAAFAVVPGSIILLLATYLLWPQFYLAHVLEARRREEMAVERITLAAALVACVLLHWSGFRFWRFALRQTSGFTTGPGKSAAALVLVLAVACFVFAGEEADWGQLYFGWKTPEKYQHVSPVTNLHAAPGIPFRLLANLFLLTMFVLLPIAWRLRLREVRALKGLAGAIPEPAVVSSVVIASLWRWVKPVFTWRVEVLPASPSFYADFLEQINEQREMLTAIALLIYALYRVRLAWRLGRRRS